jgi:hypothetical protein
MSLLEELLIVPLSSQHEGGIPSECEMGTRMSTRSANCYVQIWREAGIAPSHLVTRLPRSRDIVQATD